MTSRQVRVATKRPIGKVLDSLIADMHRLHERFDLIEADIVGPDNVCLVVRSWVTGVGAAGRGVGLSRAVYS